MSNKYVSPEKILEYVLKALDRKARAAQRPISTGPRRFPNTTQLNQWGPSDGTTAWVGNVGYVRVAGSWVVFYEDTGWVNCPLRPGRSMQGSVLPRVRRKNGLIQMRWGISGSGMAANSSYEACTVPVGFRPPDFKYFQIATNSSNSSARMSVNSVGLVEVATSAVPSYLMFDTASWYAD